MYIANASGIVYILNGSLNKAIMLKYTHKVITSIPKTFNDIFILLFDL